MDEKSMLDSGYAPGSSNEHASVSDNSIRRVRISHDQLQAIATELERLERKEEQSAPGKAALRANEEAGRPCSSTRRSMILSSCNILSRAVQDAVARSNTAEPKTVSDSKLREINEQHRLAKKGFSPNVGVEDLRQCLGDDTGGTPSIFSPKRTALRTSSRQIVGREDGRSQALFSLVDVQEKDQEEYTHVSEKWRSLQDDDEMDVHQRFQLRKMRKAGTVPNEVDFGSHRKRKRLLNEAEDPRGDKKRVKRDLRTCLARKTESRLSL